MKIRSVRAEMFHVDRRTDLTKPIVAFRNFANAPKNESNLLQVQDLKNKIRSLKHRQLK
jgi:hypothetical protein